MPSVRRNLSPIAVGRTHSANLVHLLDFEASLSRASTRRPQNRQSRCETNRYFPTRNAVLTPNTRLIPKADRKKIHEYLFREGVMVAKKDFNQPKHGEIDTKNLYVRMICDALPIYNTDIRSIGHQSRPVPCIAWLPQDPILVAVVLLHPDPRRPRLPPRVAPPASRDRPTDPRQAAALARSSTRHDGR